MIEAISKMTFRQIFAVFVCAIMFIFFGIFLFKEIPKANEQIVNILIGTFSTVFGSIIGFYFGNSQKGSSTPSVKEENTGTDTQ